MSPILEWLLRAIGNLVLTVLMLLASVFIADWALDDGSDRPPEKEYATSSERAAVLDAEFHLDDAKTCARTADVCRMAGEGEIYFCRIDLPDDAGASPFDMTTWSRDLEDRALIEIDLLDTRAPSWWRLPDGDYAWTIRTAKGGGRSLHRLFWAAPKGGNEALGIAF